MQNAHAKLLVVDDDAIALRAVSRMLARYDNQRLATSGGQALVLAHEDPPDLIIADLSMPGMSGDQLCSLVQTDLRLARVPVIIMTSDCSEEARTRMTLLGAAALVTKPLVAEQLLATVAETLRSVNVAAIEPLEAMTRSHSPDGVSSRPPLRLLAVDDDAGAIEVLKYALHGMGDVLAAGSGVEAIALAARWRPDIVLLDASMPGMDGFATCKALKARAMHRHVPVVFVTKYSDPAHETKALESGASDFISKPYSPSVLKARVQNLLSLKRRVDADLISAANRGHRLASEQIGAIIEGATDGVVTVDGRGCVQLMNSAARRTFGIDGPLVEECLAMEAIGKELNELACAAMAPSSFRFQLNRPDAQSLPLEVSVSRIREDDIELTTLILRDMSEREQLEVQSRARASAEAQSTAKSQLLAFLAHEMGNPLNCLLGFAQLLLADDRSPLTHEQARRVELIKSSGEQLATMMKDLMDLGHFEQGKMLVEVGAVDVATVIRESVRAVSGLAEQKRVGIDSNLNAGALMADADPRRLQQCLINLLSNAIKYNHNGGKVEVDTSMDQLLGVVEVSVRDSGIGMDSEQQEHLFEPFNRLGRQGSGASGSGLGLAVTKQLVEAMGGRIDVSSRINEGSCFKVSLPVRTTN